MRKGEFGKEVSETLNCISELLERSSSTFILEMRTEQNNSDKGVKIREVRCSTLLHRLNFGERPSTEYTINLFRGCLHGCTYCYAPSLIHDDRRWGSYVDVKINAPSILEKEIRRAKKDVVFLSSASDPYQAVEARYKVTRRCLEVLKKHDFPILILTRSPLVLRDIDLIKRFGWARVGFSISSVSDPIYEPAVPKLESRLKALRRLNDQGVKTWVSLAPIVPKLVLTNLDWLFKKLKEVRISAISLGLLRFNGYEQSKVMFKERTGLDSGNVLIRSQETLREVRALAERYDLDTSCSSLNWTQEKTKENSSIDSFLSQGNR